MSNYKEPKEYRQFTGPAELHKAVNTLRGIVAGITTDRNASEDEIADTIIELGGKFKDRVTNETRYLVVGTKGNPCWAFSCYGRKIEDAVKRREQGQKLTIVSEVDFWDIIEDL